MYLYLYHTENKNREPRNGESRQSRSEQSEALVRKSLTDYFFRQRPDLVEWDLAQIPIMKGDKGKPYFSGLTEEPGVQPIHYSVSHSGGWWGCLMAEEAIGFDLEVCREKLQFVKLAKRFFTQEEYKFVLDRGLECFYEMWVRKEAFVKYLGTGLAEGLDSFSVVKDGKFSDQVITQKDDKKKLQPVLIRPCEIAEGVKAAYCSISGSNIKETIKLE